MSVEPRQQRAQFVVIALIFGIPLLVAALMYQSGIWRPVGKTNTGALLLPILSLAETLPESPLHSVAEKKWLMLYVNTGECGPACREDLLRLRQSRLMLGNEMNRVERVFLHGNTPPDTVFLNEHHAGLQSITDARLDELLTRKRPAALAAGGIYLVDPLGNLVMYFTPEILPGDMVEDIKHLLDLSRIG